MKVPIGGSLFTHNCISQDYCLAESVASLVGICDKIVIVDAESSDGTLELLQELARNHHGKIEVFQSKWNPVVNTGGKWLADLANEARSHLPKGYHVCIQADEVLHPDDYYRIRSLSKTMRTYLCPRLNFWKDSRHLCARGKVVGHNICRLGPTSVPFIGDAENLDLGHSPKQSDVRIFHYGFLRKTQAQINKGRAMETAFWGIYNPIFDKMEQEGSRRAFDESIENSGPLQQYNGGHPPFIIQWLKERGHIND